MTQRTNGTGVQLYMEFAIREVNGWYVGVPLHERAWTVLEAETRNVLEYKIRRWWVGLH